MKKNDVVLVENFLPLRYLTGKIQFLSDGKVFFIGPDRIYKTFLCTEVLPDNTYGEVKEFPSEYIPSRIIIKSCSKLEDRYTFITNEKLDLSIHSTDDVKIRRYSDSFIPLSKTLFSIRMRELRGSLTEKQFSKIIQVPSSTYVSDWERDGPFPKLSYLIKLSYCLNVSIDYLLGLTSAKKYSEEYEVEQKDFKFALYTNLCNVKSSYNMSHCQFSRLTGIELKRWKNNLNPRFSTVVKVAIGLGSSVDYLVGKQTINMNILKY